MFNRPTNQHSFDVLILFFREDSPMNCKITIKGDEEMKFDYSELENKVSSGLLQSIINLISENDSIREKIIEKVKENDIYEENIDKSRGNLHDVYNYLSIVSIVFEKMDNETIKVYLRENVFGKLDI